jgi:hypothetical protein
MTNLGQTLILTMHAQPAAARWLLWQACLPDLPVVAAAPDSAASAPPPPAQSWLALGLLPPTAGGTEHARAVFAEVLRTAAQVERSSGFRRQQVASEFLCCTRIPSSSVYAGCVLVRL